MKRIIFFLILISFFGKLNSQTIEIGQDAEEIKELIKWSTNNHNQPDSYGRHSSSKAYCDIKYNNGIIKDVILCVENQYYIELGMNVDYCKHYVMEKSKLACIITQFSTISIERIIKKYDELYKDSKINNLYFDEDFKHYSKIYLANNGNVSIEWRKTELKKMPLSILKEIEIDKKNISQKKLEKEKVEKEENIKKYYDLYLYDKIIYDSLENKVKQEIIDYFSSSMNSSELEDSYLDNYKLWIPSFKKISYSREKKYRYNNSFVAHYQTGYGESSHFNLQLQNIILYSGTKEDSISMAMTYIDKIIKSYTKIMPFLQINGNTVETEARIIINIDFAKGITTVKIQNGKLEFIENVPDEDLLDQIKKKLELKIVRLRGKYVVEYEYRNIMNDIYLNAELVKR